jgi:hypothetical protein
VTFQNIDPLWTVDLSDVKNPRILGELHVPGVSTYIHPLGDHLLTIGLGGTDDGLDWGTTQLSMFNITDRTQPALESSLQLSAGSAQDGWQYSSSEATYEHDVECDGAAGSPRTGGSATTTRIVAAVGECDLASWLHHGETGVRAPSAPDRMHQACENTSCMACFK